MKREIVHRYTCEGCGAQRITTEEIAAFGQHARGASGYGELVEGEAACVAYTKRIELQRARDEQARREWCGRLAEKCAQDAIFRTLTRVFPAEFGDTQWAPYLGLRMEELAAFVPGMSLSAATARTGAYDELLRQCISAARAAAVQADIEAKRG